MGILPSDERLVDAIAELAGTSGTGLEVPEVLHPLAVTTVELLAAETVSVALADRAGRLETVAIAGHDGRYSELFVGDTADGPGAESYRRGEIVSVPDLAPEEDRRRAFTSKALRLGFRSVHAVPLRCRDQVLGALSLARTRAGPLTRSEIAAIRCLTSVATLTLVHDRAQRSHAEVRGQLETALESRIVIEQAKGYLAHRNDETTDEAFARLRGHARDHGQRLATVAEAVISGRLDLD